MRLLTKILAGALVASMAFGAAAVAWRTPATQPKIDPARLQAITSEVAKLSAPPPQHDYTELVEALAKESEKSDRSKVSTVESRELIQQKIDAERQYEADELRRRVTELEEKIP